MTLILAPENPMLSSHLPPVKLGISTANRAIARQFADQHTTEKKRQQVYLNTLAVSVVNVYLQGLDITTDLENSASWQFHNQALDDVADLLIPGWGRLACRPVLTDVDYCPLSSGGPGKCVAVQFDSEFNYATLVGFKDAIAPHITEIPLSEFEDFDTLLDQIPEPAQQRQHEPVSNCLSDWLSGMVPEIWQQIDQLLGPQLMPVRSRPPVVERGKVLVLDGATDPVALVVWVDEPTPSPEIDVAVELWPMNAQHHLPETLELQLLDNASGTSLMHAQARGSDRLQFTFTGEPGDAFEVKVTLKDTTIIEAFVI